MWTSVIRKPKDHIFSQKEHFGWPDSSTMYSGTHFLVSHPLSSLIGIECYSCEGLILNQTTVLSHLGRLLLVHFDWTTASWQERRTYLEVCSLIGRSWRCILVFAFAWLLDRLSRWGVERLRDEYMRKYFVNMHQENYVWTRVAFPILWLILRKLITHNWTQAGGC